MKGIENVVCVDRRTSAYPLTRYRNKPQSHFSAIKNALQSKTIAPQRYNRGSEYHRVSESYIKMMTFN